MTTPACQPGALPPRGSAIDSTSSPLRAMSQAIVEFEFHISPACSASRPQTGVGTSGTSSSSRRAQSGSSLRRFGLSTASAMSAMSRSNLRASVGPRREEREARQRSGADRAFADDAPLLVLSPYRRLLDHEPRLGNVDLQCRVVEVAAPSPVEPCREPLEHASVPPNGVAAGAERQPVQVDAWAEEKPFGSAIRLSVVAGVSGAGPPSSLLPSLSRDIHRPAHPRHRGSPAVDT